MVEALKLTEQEEEKLQTTNELTEEANALQVVDPDTHTEASDLLVRLQTKKREIEDIRDHQLEPIKSAKREIEEARKRVVAFFDQPLNALARVKRELDQRMISWRQAERRKAQLEAEKARAKLLKEQEAERKKKEKIAASLEKKGLAEDAAEVRDRIAVEPAPAPVVVTPPIETVKGASVKITKRAKVNEVVQRGFLAAAVEKWNETHTSEFHIVPADYWQLNQKALDAFGQKTEGQVQVPGVEWYDDEETIARRRK